VIYEHLGEVSKREGIEEGREEEEARRGRRASILWV